MLKIKRPSKYSQRGAIASPQSNRLACILVASCGSIRSVSFDGISGEFAGRFRQFFPDRISGVGRLEMAMCRGNLETSRSNADTVFAAPVRVEGIGKVFMTRATAVSLGIDSRVD
jgi:hypothetical protein